MAQVASHLAVPGYLRKLVQGFLEEEPEQLTLHLNAGNPTIRKLAARHDLADEVSRHALVALYNNALMLLARSLPVDTVQAMVAQQNQVIALLLSLAER
jgi:HSP90 family molecular chaperone